MYVHVAHSLWEFIGRMEEEPTQHLQRGVMLQKSVEYLDDLSKCVDKGSLSLKCPKEFKFSLNKRIIHWLKDKKGNVG